jgi:hypothetical protein
MTASSEISQEPLWIAMEKKILEHASGGSSAADLESAIKKIASELDQSGYSVSNHAGNLLQLRWAMEEKSRNGKALMQDLDTAIKKLTFDDVENAKAATARIISALGATWPKLQDSERKPDILDMVENVRLGFLVQRAKERSEGEGIRYLIDSEIAVDVILESLGITQERYDQEVAAIKAEEEKKAKVRSLLEAVADKPEEERIKHLINNEIADDLIIEIAEVEQSSIDGVKKSMEEELKEKQRLAEEEAAKKAAAAAGPPLEEISMEDRLTHIEAIRDIMDLCDAEEDIRKMCEQSNVPKCLVDIAVSDPDKLDELEAEAEG